MISAKSNAESEVIKPSEKAVLRKRSVTETDENAYDDEYDYEHEHEHAYEQDYENEYAHAHGLRIRTIVCMRSPPHPVLRDRVSESYW
jgi:hypothetical protein